MDNAAINEIVKAEGRIRVKDQTYQLWDNL